MATTFKDFMFECENYDHSKESFELMQECSELALMEKYIEDQEFYQENASVFTEGVEVEAGYFAESADDATIQALMEKAANKGNSIKYRIFKGLMKIFKTFAGFFMKLGNKTDSITASGQKVRKDLASIDMDADKLESLKSIIERAKAKGQGFTPKSKQPYASRIKVGGSISGLQTMIDGARIIDWIAAALSDQTVVANVAYSKSEKRIGALPIDVIIDTGAMIALGNKKSIPVEAALKNLTSAWINAQQKGITIQVNTKSINRAVKAFEQIQQQVENMLGEVGTRVTDSINQVKAMGRAVATMIPDKLTDREDRVGKVASQVKAIAGEYADETKSFEVAESAMNKLYTLINITIGASMRVYSSLNNYRSAAISALSDWISKSGSGTAATADDSKEGESKTDDEGGRK